MWNAFRKWLCRDIIEAAQEEIREECLKEVRQREDQLRSERYLKTINSKTDAELLKDAQSPESIAAMGRMMRRREENRQQNMQVNEIQEKAARDLDESVRWHEKQREYKWQGLPTDAELFPKWFGAQ